MSEELKTCPFCGGEAELIGLTTFNISCTQCDCELGVEASAADAIAHWNRRAREAFSGAPAGITEVAMARAIYDASDFANWDGQTAEVKLRWMNKASRVLAALPLPSVRGDRDAVIEQCAAILDEAAQDWNRIRDPGMANNARSYARKIRALKAPHAKS